MFVEGAAMLIRWKQGTQKVKANFDNAAKTRAGKAQPGTAKRRRERELPRHSSTSQVSVTKDFSRLHSTAAIIPRQPLRKGCGLARCRPQRLAESVLCSQHAEAMTETRLAPAPGQSPGLNEPNTIWENMIWDGCRTKGGSYPCCA